MIRRVVIVLAGLLLGGCVAVTVNVNFPQDTIDKAASSIEDEVRTPSSPPAPAPGRGALRSARPGVQVARVWLGVGAAHANEVNVDAGRKSGPARRKCRLSWTHGAPGTHGCRP